MNLEILIKIYIVTNENNGVLRNGNISETVTPN